MKEVPTADTPPPNPPGPGNWASRLTDPLHAHTAFSATLLLAGAVMVSRVIGYLREAYIAYAFGAGPETDAYVAAFTLPDWLNYLAAGGAASITFIAIYTRYCAEKREEDAQRAFSIILTVMTAVLTVGVVLGAVFARPIERVIFPKFTEEQLDLCVSLTRVLLPAQIFFYAGAIVSAVLMSRRYFLFPALGPLLYNVGIILGGVLLGSRLGVASLAVGALAGCIAGPFLVNVLGAARAGVSYRASFAVRDPVFLEWLRKSIPLMLGVTLVAADEWILRFFASGSVGDITRLNYAKRLFAVPIAVLGQATAQATLPFFAGLYGEKRFGDFAAAINKAVGRVSAVALLATAWMAAAALPAVDLVYRRGRFQFSDSTETAAYFFWFSLSLAFWAAQGLYARAFYAAGDTMTPMVAGTVVTLLSLPVYAWLFDARDVVGLAMASGVGILAHTVVLAVLLSRRRLVPLAELPWVEVAKAAATALVAWAAASGVSRMVAIDGSHRADLKALALITVTWAGAVAAGLWLTRSQILTWLRRRP